VVKIEILAPGKVKHGYLEEALDDYLGRLRNYVTVSLREVKVHSSPTIQERHRQEVESGLLLNRVNQESFLIFLDQRGKQYSSQGLADFLKTMEERGRRLLSFVVGGPLGFTDKDRKRADLLLSLSQMTFTHDMCRVLLVEQLYRACTINQGGKYHKQG
jgi:23S rRNA (pseudouridine1915-N3)-methyltransferase